MTAKGYSPKFVYDTGDQKEAVKNYFIIVSYNDPYASAEKPNDPKEGWSLQLGWADDKGGKLFSLVTSDFGFKIEDNNVKTGAILNPNAYKGPLFNFKSGDKIWFSLWPNEKISYQKVDLSELAKGSWFSEWEPSENDCVLSSNWPNYVKRIEEHNKKLEDLLSKAKERLGTYSGMYGLYSTAKEIVYQRQAAKYEKYLLRENEKFRALGNMAISLSALECNMIIEEMINPPMEQLRNSYRRIAQEYKKQIDPVAKELWDILQDNLFISQYKQHYKPGSDTKVLSDEDLTVFSDAYLLLSRTSYGEEVYKKHLSLFYSEDFKKVAETCDWVGKLGGELLNVTDAYAVFSMAKMVKTGAVDMGRFKKDFLVTAKYLEEAKLMKNVDKLEETVNTALKSGTTINAAEFVPDSKFRVNMIASLQAGLSLIATVAAVTDQQKEGWEMAGNVTKTSLGFASDVSKIGKIAEKLPTFAKWGARGGVVGNFIDTGMAYSDMYQHAQPGMEEVFYTDFVMYMGKGIATAGAALSLTPLAPLGLALVAIGAAIDIIGSISQGALTYETVEQKQYNKIIDEAHGKDKDGSAKPFYEVGSDKKTRNTQFYQKMIKACDPQPGDSERTKEAYAKIKEAIQNYYGKDKTVKDVLKEHWKEGWLRGTPYGVLDEFDL